jgi:adenosylcobinamide-GDP ribazoletransferase
VIGDLRLALSFLTRLRISLPVTLPPHALGRAMWAFPVVGAFIGALSSVAFILARKILPEWPSALLTLAAALLLTGALHEDGLADCADGFGGGWDKEKKLAIMRDSRIGTYGALALLLSLLLRASALTRFHHAPAALVAAHCLSRTALPVLAWIMRPASATGLAAAAGRPPGLAVLVALALGSALTVDFYTVNALRPLIAAALATATIGLLAQRQIGGYTGDVLGAAEQTVEIAVLLAILPLP